jgi:hypothetical protein
MISAIGLAWTIGSAFVLLLVAGTVAYVNMQNDIAKAKKDNNAIGIKLGRLISMLADPAWSDSPEKQKQLSKLIEPKW